MKKFLVLSFSIGFAFIFAFVFNAGEIKAQSYGNLSKKEARKIIKRLENETDIYRRALDDYLDDSRVDGSDRETRINDRMKEFEKALDDAKRRFDTGDSFEQSRPVIEEIVRSANPVNEIMLRGRFNETLKLRWSNIRKEVNRLARNYELETLPN